MWSDYLCPWCYVGRDRTTAHSNDSGVRRDARCPTSCTPRSRPQGRTRATRWPAARRCSTASRPSATAAGCPFRRPTRMPNTRRALETAEVVRATWPDAFAALDDALFRAHFVDWLAARRRGRPRRPGRRPAGAPADDVRDAVDAGDRLSTRSIESMADGARGRRDRDAGLVGRRAVRDPGRATARDDATLGLAPVGPGRRAPLIASLGPPVSAPGGSRLHPGGDGPPGCSYLFFAPPSAGPAPSARLPSSAGAFLAVDLLAGAFLRRLRRLLGGRFLAGGFLAVLVFLPPSSAVPSWRVRAFLRRGDLLRRRLAGRCLPGCGLLGRCSSWPATSCAVFLAWCHAWCLLGWFVLRCVLVGRRGVRRSSRRCRGERDRCPGVASRTTAPRRNGPRRSPAPHGHWSAADRPSPSTGCSTGRRR